MNIKWIGWTVLVLGLWVLVSPWVAPFLGITDPWNSIFSGAIVIICGLWWLFGDKPQADTKL
jgi:hypothetical protein